MAVVGGGVYGVGGVGRGAMWEGIIAREAVKFQEKRKRLLTSPLASPDLELGSEIILLHLGTV